MIPSRLRCDLTSEALKEQEQDAILEDALDQAEDFSNQIRELREKEILLKNFLLIEHNQKEVG